MQKGLTKEKVEEKRKVYGDNELKAAKKKTLFHHVYQFLSIYQNLIISK